MKNNKKKLAGASALALIALGAGTFAWFTSKDDVTNHFEGQLAGNDIQIIETFEPETTWQPGEEINKDVAIANVSSYNALTRVSFTEVLNLLKDVTELRYDGVTYVDSQGNVKTVEIPMVMPSNSDYDSQGYTNVTASLTAPVSSVSVDGKTYDFNLFAKETSTNPSQYSYVAQWVSGTEKAKAYIGNTSNLINRDEKGNLSFENVTPKISVVDKSYQAPKESDWTKPVYSKTPDNVVTFKSEIDDNLELSFVNVTEIPTQDKWYFNGADGYFYFVGNVAPGASTAQLLDSVKLLGGAGNEYSLFTYDLNVKAEGIQSAKEAVSETWATATGELATLLQAQCDY